MIKRKLVTLVILIIAMSSVFIYALAKNSYDESNFVPKWGINDDSKKIKDDKSGEVMPPLVKNPQHFYSDNKDTPKDKLYDINKKINKDKLKAENAEITTLKLMTYKEFLESEKNTTEIDTSVSTERLIWVVKIHYPNGINICNSRFKTENKNVVIKNALRTILYDAETGDFISSKDATEKN